MNISTLTLSQETLISIVSCAFGRGMELYGNRTARDYYDYNVFDAVQFIQLKASLSFLRDIILN